VSFRELLQTALTHGVPVERALEYLRASGASPIEAALALQDVTGAAPQEARELVTRTRAWSAPRSGAPAVATPPREWHGAIGQHGLSGHGASSILPHLVRQTLAQGAGGR
jgi:hypothetical protein